jgi:hypothetical protein
MNARFALAALPLLLVAACSNTTGSDGAAPPPGSVAQAPLPAGGPIALAPPPAGYTPPQMTVPAQPMPMPPPAAPMAVTGMVDGIYQGRTTLVEGEPFIVMPTDAQPPQLYAASKIPVGCPTDRKGLIEIGDKVLLVSYIPNVVLVSPVSPDGVVHASAGDYVMDGTLVDGQLEFTVTGHGCKSVFSYTRQNAF